MELVALPASDSLRTIYENSAAYLAKRNDYGKQKENSYKAFHLDLISQRFYIRRRICDRDFNEEKICR